VLVLGLVAILVLGWIAVEASGACFWRRSRTIVNDCVVSASGAFYYVMKLLHGLDSNSMIEKFGRNETLPWARHVPVPLTSACG
jgi:hypothetical protein